MKTVRINTTYLLPAITTSETTPVIDLSTGDNLGIVIVPAQVGTTSLTGSIVAQLQVSNDKSVWLNQGSTMSITAGTNFGVVLTNPAFLSARVVVSGVTAGTLSVSAITALTGNAS